MINVTLKQVRNLPLCIDYTQNDYALLEEMANGETELPLAVILKQDGVPVHDRVWLACQDDELPEDMRKKWKERTVQRAVVNHAMNCGVDFVEQWAMGWINETDRSTDLAWVIWRNARESRMCWPALRAIHAAANLEWISSDKFELMRECACAAFEAQDGHAKGEAAAIEEYQAQLTNLLAIMEVDA